MIRPEIRAWVFRWREVLAFGGIGLLAALWATSLRTGWIFDFVLWVIAAFTLTAAGSAWRVQRLNKDQFAVGFVEMDERQIAYFARSEGWTVSTEDLIEIAIDISEKRPFTSHIHWELRDMFGSVMRVPTGARGADEMIRVLSARRGFDYTGAVQSAEADTPQRQVVWRRKT